MVKPQLNRVQRDRDRAPIAALVQRVADDRMTEAREVRADLMRATGRELELDVRAIGVALDHAVMSDGRRTVRDDRAAIVVEWIATERRIFHTRPFHP